MKVVLLAGRSASTPIVFNYLNKEINFEAVLIEEKIPATQILKRRVKKLGYATVLGQVLFQIIVVKILQKQSRDRIRDILAANGLQNTPIPAEKIINVTSVNADEVIEILKQISPDVVVVNGTRIISKEVLDAIPAPFMNMHVGITPGYRGVHGAYWALVNKDKCNAGVTVHYVDQGIDTGKVIAQDIIDVTEKDNFVTYPYLQTAKGLNLMLKAIKSIEKGERPKSDAKVSFSKLWSHPTIFGYIYHLIAKGVK